MPTINLTKRELQMLIKVTDAVLTNLESDPRFPPGSFKENYENWIFNATAAEHEHLQDALAKLAKAVKPC